MGGEEVGGEEVEGGEEEVEEGEAEVEVGGEEGDGAGVPEGVDQEGDEEGGHQGVGEGDGGGGPDAVDGGAEGEQQEAEDEGYGEGCEGGLTVEGTHLADGAARVGDGELGPDGVEHEVYKDLDEVAHGACDGERYHERRSEVGVDYHGGAVEHGGIAHGEGHLACAVDQNGAHGGEVQAGGCGAEAEDGCGAQGLYDGVDEVWDAHQSGHQGHGEVGDEAYGDDADGDEARQMVHDGDFMVAVYGAEDGIWHIHEHTYKRLGHKPEEHSTGFTVGDATE